MSEPMSGTVEAEACDARRFTQGRVSGCYLIGFTGFPTVGNCQGHWLAGCGRYSVHDAHGSLLDCCHAV